MKIVKQASLSQWRHDNKPERCPILGTALDHGSAVVDHDHASGLIRGVIDRQANVLLGKIERLQKTFLKCSNDELRLILMRCVDWMDSHESDTSETMPFHPKGKARMITKFRAMPKSQQEAMLIAVGQMADVQFPIGDTKAERLKQLKLLLKKLES